MVRVSPDELNRRIAAFSRALRKAGLKVTPQRLAIFREVARSVEHPDAEMVFKRVRARMPTLSRDTVYRTLGLLEEANLVWKVGTVRGRGRFDAKMEPHHHFICSKCARVQDFASRSLNGLKAPKEAQALGIVTSVRLQARGVCSSCAAPKRERHKK